MSPSLYVKIYSGHTTFPLFVLCFPSRIRFTDVVFALTNTEKIPPWRQVVQLHLFCSLSLTIPSIVLCFIEIHCELSTYRSFVLDHSKWTITILSMSYDHWSLYTTVRNTNTSFHDCFKAGWIYFIFFSIRIQVILQNVLSNEINRTQIFIYFSKNVSIAYGESHDFFFLL